MMPSPIGDLVCIRWMLRSDVPDVLEIAAGHPSGFRSEDNLLSVMDVRENIGMVAQHASQVVGYMVYQLWPTRLVVLDLAVAPGLRRRGIGRRLVAKLVGKLSAHRRTRLDLDVADDALGAHLFLKACGFRAVMLPTTDVYRFTYRIDVLDPVETVSRDD